MPKKNTKKANALMSINLGLSDDDDDDDPGLPNKSPSPKRGLNASPKRGFASQGGGSSPSRSMDTSPKRGLNASRGQSVSDLLSGPKDPTMMFGGGGPRRSTWGGSTGLNSSALSGVSGGDPLDMLKQEVAQRSAGQQDDQEELEF